MAKKKNRTSGLGPKRKLFLLCSGMFLIFIAILLFSDFFSADSAISSSKRICSESVPKLVEEGDLKVQVYDTRTSKLMTLDTFNETFNFAKKEGKLYQKLQGKTCGSNGCKTQNRDSLPYLITPETQMRVALYQTDNVCKIGKAQLKRSYYYVGLASGTEILQKGNASTETYIIKNIATLYAWPKGSKTVSVRTVKSVKSPVATNNLSKAQKYFNGLTSSSIKFRINPDKIK